MMLNFQFDRHVTLNVFGPITKIFSKRNRCCIPILMYHSISNHLENSVHPYYQTSTSPDIFRKHMRFLHEKEYSVISIQDFSKNLVNQDSEACKAVILTFDDGFKDFYKHAFPILEHYGYSASVCHGNRPDADRHAHQHLARSVEHRLPDDPLRCLIVIGGADAVFCI